MVRSQPQAGIVIAGDGADTTVPHVAVTHAPYDELPTSPNRVRELDGSMEYSRGPSHSGRVSQTL
jgi:hypothetical protein